MKVNKDKIMKMFSGQLLTMATLASVVFGVIIGLIIRVASSEKWSERDIMYLNYIGELFLRMLKGLILPLIVSSLIAAISSLNLSSSGRIGARAITYYMITTCMAVLLGVILVVSIRPGVDRNATENATEPIQLTSSRLRSSTTTDTMLDLVRNMFPPNIIQACLEQYQTILKQPADNLTIGKWLLENVIGKSSLTVGFFICYR